MAVTEVSQPDPWRRPPEESVDLYPGLVVLDNRVSGSITIGQSRLPLWAIIGTAVRDGWPYVELDYSPTELYGFTEDDLAGFLGYLLEQRGEFGRLLLTLANAERIEHHRQDQALAPHGPVVNITPGDPDAVELPPPWWATPGLVDPVRLQLLRCLMVLGHTGSDIHVHLYEHGDSHEQAAVLRRLADLIERPADEPNGSEQ